MSSFSNIIFVHVLACEDSIASLLLFSAHFLACLTTFLFFSPVIEFVEINMNQKNPLNYLQSNFSGVLYPIVTITSCKKWPNKSRAPLPLCSSCFYSTLQRRQRSQISSSVFLIKSDRFTSATMSHTGPNLSTTTNVTYTKIYTIYTLFTPK